MWATRNALFLLLPKARDGNASNRDEGNVPSRDDEMVGNVPTRDDRDVPSRDVGNVRGEGSAQV